MSAVAGSVGQVLALYERWGSELYDEEIRQRDHALQTAALARAAGADDPLVAAALLHDVGHLLEMAEADGPRSRTTDLRHEARGASYLAGLFPPGVTAPIALHVRAKRYLVTVDPGYRALLSSGSTASLARQGGALSLEEAAAFEANSGWADAVQLRRWDDQGKVDGLDLPPLDAYRPLLVDLCIASTA